MCPFDRRLFVIPFALWSLLTSSLLRDHPTSIPHAVVPCFSTACTHPSLAWERVDLPGIHDHLVQARHALRPRRNLHSLAFGAVPPSLVRAAHTAASCCLLSHEEHRLPLDGITRLNHFTHPPKMRAALRLACSRYVCFKSQIKLLRLVPCGWAPTYRYWLLARLYQTGHVSRCLS